MARCMNTRRSARRHEDVTRRSSGPPARARESNVNLTAGRPREGATGVYVSAPTIAAADSPIILTRGATRTIPGPARGDDDDNYKSSGRSPTAREPPRCPGDRRGAAAGDLGARVRQHVHGRFLGDDPRAAAGLPGDGPGHLDADGRRHRGRRRSHRLPDQHFFRGVIRLAGQAQSADRGRLRAGGVHQAGVPAGRDGRVGCGGAVHRPGRQGHPRRAAGCADRRPEPPPPCAARASDCGNRWTRSAPSSARSPPSPS
jgi:hypothetical protein